MYQIPLGNVFMAWKVETCFFLAFVKKKKKNICTQDYVFFDFRYENNKRGPLARSEGTRYVPNSDVRKKRDR